MLRGAHPLSHQKITDLSALEFLEPLRIFHILYLDVGVGSLIEGVTLAYSPICFYASFTLLVDAMRCLFLAMTSGGNLEWMLEGEEGQCGLCWYNLQ